MGGLWDVRVNGFGLRWHLMLQKYLSNVKFCYVNVEDRRRTHWLEEALHTGRRNQSQDCGNHQNIKSQPSGRSMLWVPARVVGTDRIMHRHINLVLEHTLGFL